MWQGCLQLQLHLRHILRRTIAGWTGTSAILIATDARSGRSAIEQLPPLGAAAAANLITAMVSMHGGTGIGTASAIIATVTTVGSISRFGGASRWLAAAAVHGCSLHFLALSLLDCT